MCSKSTTVNYKLQIVWTNSFASEQVYIGIVELIDLMTAYLVSLSVALLV
jgi:hypothetical protein